jgi:polysaccharide pyruvyl transferase WcaK-like protein
VPSSLPLRAASVTKILLISTRNHNPGDEIIRLGAEHILRRVFPNASFTTIHKHDPRTLFAGFKQRTRSPHRLIAPRLYQSYASMFGRRRENYLETADLVVFAGTPFIWRSAVRLFRFTCENAEWVDATWGRLFRTFPNKPVMNLAAGTSVTNQEQFEGILSDPVVKGFLTQAVQRSALTTARDVKTQAVLAALGFDTPLLPCASIMAAKGARIAPQRPEYVVINVMPSAAHRWRGQPGNSEQWRRTIQWVVAGIQKRHRLLFVSHSEDEDQIAKEWFPNHPRFLSKNPLALLQVYSKALYGVCNRVHATAAIASFNRPAIVVGGDSRINLVEQFGLPALDHRDLDSGSLSLVIDEVERNYDIYVDKLRQRALYTESAYLAKISYALKLREIPVMAG